MTSLRFDRRGTLVLAGAGFSTLLLSACQTSVNRTVWPDITFSHREPVAMAVNGVEVSDASGAAAVQPPAHDIRNALPVSPLATMDNWAHQRIAPMGGYGTARVTITENRFVEVPLETQQGVEGLFTNSQSERYEGALGVRVEVVGDPSGSGFAEARATASRTVPEDFSINQREQALYDMIAAIVHNLNERLVSEIRGNLSRWVAMG
jgi:hypothetical protein